MSSSVRNGHETARKSESFEDALWRAGRDYGTMARPGDSKRFQTDIVLTSRLAWKPAIAKEMQMQASDDSKASGRFKRAFDLNDGFKRVFDLQVMC